MTTNKPGTVNQRPLYGCTSCYEEFSWPASDLRVYDTECWCELCWGDRQWDFPDHPDWASLERFTPALQAENEKLRKASSELANCSFHEAGFSVRDACAAPQPVPEGYVLMPESLPNEAVKAFALATVGDWDNRPEDQRVEVAEKLQLAFDAMVAATQPPQDGEADE